ncbi:MAG: electron transfer flavoprotein subunit beta/FixA family protein [Promethearchaeota archaeon]
MELKNNKLIAERKFRAIEIVVIETNLPALISVLNDVNEPRYPSMAGIMKAHNKEIVQLDSAALNADPSKIGLNGSSTEVWKIFVPKRKGDRVILRGTIEEVVQKLCQNLKDDKVL